MNVADPKGYGCVISDSVFEYIWDVSILVSLMNRSALRWSAAGAAVPASWTGKQANPSFWINLESNSTPGIVRSIKDTLICMRPALWINATALPEQTATLEKGSYIYQSPFLHTIDPACQGDLPMAVMHRTVFV